MSAQARQLRENDIKIYPPTFEELVYERTEDNQVGERLDNKLKGMRNEMTEMNESLEANTIEEAIDILPYTSSNQFVAPKNGYVSVNCLSASNELWLGLYDSQGNGIGTLGFTNTKAYGCYFVKKGFKLATLKNSGSDNSANFYPLI